jgi:V8-like Glu-specific endopeptidase
MDLSPSDRKKLREAILSAYPNPGELEIMVDEELGENLQAIAGGENLKEVVFNLIKWAEARGKLERLIIAAYDANSGNPQLKEFYHYIIERKFIINPAPVESSVNIGPDIEWLGPTDNIQLESYLQPEPEFWDAIFFKRAVENLASVCKIEIPSQRTRGTGVLIANRLVLTNYHVLESNNHTDIKTNALDAILHFGYFSSDSGNESEGQVFKLDRQQPILNFSPTEKLDYVLLQVEESIVQAMGIQPARWNANNLPQPRQGINLVQHPKGDTMKVSISRDGITEVSQERGLIQYVSKTEPGSSGSPCFDENWNLVALHHAQRDRMFSSIRGTIREGILFSSIYQEIASYLKH